MLAIVDGGTDRGLDGLGFRFESERVAQQHSGRKNRARGIRDALAGDIGSRTVDGLVQTEFAFAE